MKNIYFLDQRKSAKMQQLKNPNRSNADNLKQCKNWS